MTDLVPQYDSPLTHFGRVADEQARLNALTEYQRNLSDQTLRRHQTDLALFQRYLKERTGVIVQNLFTSLQEWNEITWGMVYDFQEWMMAQGYAMGSVDLRIVTAKKYMKLAYAAGYVSKDDLLHLLNMKGHSESVRKHIDEKREIKRIGTKKASPTTITPAHLRALRELLSQEAHTYMGARDLVLLCLLGYHGMRCIEVHDLKRNDIDVSGNRLTFYRRKVDLTDNHEMNHITLMVMRKYLSIIPKKQHKLFLGVDREEWIDRQGKVHRALRAEDGLSTRAINQRVRKFGEIIGIAGLSPHDLRHACIDDLAKNGTPIELLKLVGGWKSFVMPDHYTRRAAITNKGINQSQW